MQKTKEGRTYYPALDGMRGMAILLVLAHHNFSNASITRIGWLGVDLFFVLSGFLITTILLKAGSHKHWLRNFYSNRILRIFPLYFLSLLVFLLVLPAIGYKVAVFEYYIHHQLWLWTFLQNWAFILHPTNQYVILHHYWSLAVEEQFYLVWPFIIIVMKTPGKLLTCIGMLLIGSILVKAFLWLQYSENISYYHLYLFTRIDGICVGSTIAILHYFRPNFLIENGVKIIAFTSITTILLYLVNQNLSLKLPFLALGGYLSIAIGFGCLVYAGVIGKNRLVTTIFSNSVLSFFGRISFGLYIWHWPVFVLFNDDVLNWLPVNLNYWWVASIISTFLAVLFSLASYHCFEKVFLNLKHRPQTYYTL